MQATAIIGAVFGDEVKGKFTSWVSREPNAIVIRYNGGAQAGHTVVLPDGTRHVFHHFGSGSFNGADTYLSQHFLINPFVWHQERAELQALGINPKLYIHPSALVSTHYDMLINQELEKSRGVKHGSCRYGINETVERSARYPITYGDLYDTATIVELLREIRDEWVPKRLKQLGLVSNKFNNLLDNRNLLDWFLKYSGDLMATSWTQCDQTITREKWDNIIFEGAQGLLLDEDNVEFFPHLTRSKCGLPNIVKICKNAGITDLKVIYATRAYATRHGAGPFPTEDANLRYSDATNSPNQYQGTLRFGNLNLDLLVKAIENDLTKADGINITHGLAMSCLDQVPEYVEYTYDGIKQITTKDELPSIAADAIGAKFIYISEGENTPIKELSNTNLNISI